MGLEAQAEQFDDFGGPAEAVIPRVSIEAFCETEGFATALKAAGEDRRMAKASLAVSMGGVPKAASTYADAMTPNLLIVESAEGGFSVFGELEQLAEVCDPDTKVVVAAPSNDVTLYRELMRQGVDEYIVTPSSPMQVIDAIASVYAESGKAPLARAIGFIGVKGGVGASTLAHNTAALISDTGREVMLIDLDVEFGTAGLDFDQEPTRTVVDALADVAELDDVKLKRLLIEQSPTLKILAAPSSLDASMDVDEGAILALLDVARRSSDVVVFDIPHGWSPWLRQAVLQMDEVVLVAGPDIASLRNLKNMHEVLKTRRPNDAPPRIVINQIGVAKRPEIPVKEFASIVGTKPDMTLAFDGALFGAAANGGQMLSDIQPSARIVGDLKDFCQTILPSGRKRLATAPAAKGIGGMFERLRGLGKRRGAKK